MKEAKTNKKPLRSVNIRVYEEDHQQLLQLATEAGMDYQPFLRSVLHKLVNNELIDTSFFARKPSCILFNPDSTMMSALTEIFQHARKNGINIATLNTKDGKLKKEIFNHD